MAGHSKWANIKHRKAASDAKKSKITTRLVKEITIAAKNGGDPDANPRLRLAIEKARENNVPKDNIERAIKRGTGEIAGINYEELRFEGYGIAGSGVIVDCLTDNKTRTVAEVRHVFSKYGGNLGTDGCVSYQFLNCGQIIFAPGINEEKLIEVALEIGAQDIISNDDGSIEVITLVTDFIDIKSAFENSGFHPAIAEIVMKAINENILTGEDAIKMQKMLDAFDELDDVQNVYTTVALEE